MRRFIAIFITLILIIQLFAASVFATDITDRFNFRLSESFHKSVGALRLSENLGKLTASARDTLLCIKTGNKAAPPNTGDQSFDEYFGENFIPKLRFIVASDVHITGENCKQAERVQKLFSYTQTNYGEFAAAVFAGDISNNSNVELMKTAKSIIDNAAKEVNTQAVYVMGNHEGCDVPFHATKNFEKGFAVDAKGHLEIGGYHFIYVSPNLQGGESYSLSVLNWLDKELKKAAMDDPYKPIFVFHHHHIKGTVYGSGRWGTSELFAVLAKYPQVVDFSGHSHFPISDPRSVWQGAFTALGTGSLSYTELGVNDVAADHLYPPQQGSTLYSEDHVVDDASWYYVVEVNENGSVRITGVDLDNECEVAHYGIREPWNPSSFIYTDSRYQKSAAPTFAEDAKIEAEIKDRSIKVTFPAASCPDNVESYRVELWHGAILKDVERHLSMNFYGEGNTPKTYTSSFDKICSSGNYTIKVYAINSFGKESKPLKWSN